MLNNHLSKSLDSSRNKIWTFGNLSQNNACILKGLTRSYRNRTATGFLMGLYCDAIVYVGYNWLIAALNLNGHQARIQGGIGGTCPRVKNEEEKKRKRKRREGRRGEKKGREGDIVSILLQSQ